MQHYVEITLLPTDDIGHYFLWGKIYQQLHLALVELTAGQGGNVGFSFPEYSAKQPHLGRKVRVFAPSEAQLVQFNASKWLGRLSDYCHVSSIRAAPEKTQYAIFNRKQCVNNTERLARRRAKRKGETFEQALAHFAGFDGEFSSLPFVALESLSTEPVAETHHRFKLFIDQKIVSQSQDGGFNCYGLSNTSTVPWF
jgi:CRISPR-associated endonuclease Csy4